MRPAHPTTLLPPVLALAALLLAAAAAPELAALHSWRPPSFCGALPCPRFEVLRRDQGYELRRYARSLWVQTNVSALHNYEAAVRMASAKLFPYFWGHNQEGLRMQETVPLAVGFRTDVAPHAGMGLNYTIALYLPPQFHNDAPTPQHPDIWLERMPRRDVFVRAFHARPTEGRAHRQAKTLARALDKGEERYQGGYVVVASYDHPAEHPWKRARRYSEVGLLALQ